MPQTRRTLIKHGLGLVGAGLAPFGLPRAQRPRFAANPFSLGVASGYPEARAVVLWTRLAPTPLAPGGGMPPAIVEVDWEVADDDRFVSVRRRGSSYATPEWGHSVHVEVTGLEPGRDYWYRFTSGDAQSPVGHTRTAAEDPRALAIAVASCQHFESGHYAAYAAMTRDDLDLVLHVGDYIYENRGMQDRVRGHDAPECYTLDDYRQRYAIYKSDPSLQAAHAACPWMMTSDDHEVDNDYAGARSEQEDVEALFLARRAAAYQAYYEHMPLPGAAVPFGAYQRLHTARAFGELADVLMLDGRQYRSDQACGRGLVPGCEALFAEDRTMLGAEQERWLMRGLETRRGRWKLIAQQTMFADVDQRPGPEIGYWSDAWAGYPAARQRLLDFVAARRIVNPVVLSGDIHAFVVNDVHLKRRDFESPIVATELVTTSISSFGPSQAGVDAWARENPNVHLARSDRRGYTRLVLRPGALRADLVAVDDSDDPGSATHVLASYVVEHDRAGAQNA